MHGSPSLTSSSYLGMADLATPDFLSTLKTAYPPETPNSPSHLWAVVAAVSFSSSNVPEAVPLVFEYALDDLLRCQTQAGTPQGAAHQEQLVLARKVREAVLQAGLLCGMPRVSTSTCSMGIRITNYNGHKAHRYVRYAVSSVGRPFFLRIRDVRCRGFSDADAVGHPRRHEYWSNI